MRWSRTIGAVVVVGVVSAGGYAFYGRDLRADDATARTVSTAPDPSPAAAMPGGLDAERPVLPRPAPEVPQLDPRCERGRVLCVDKTTRTLRWVVDGKTLMTFDARFGGPRTPTREGVFEVYDMLRRHESSLYGTQMPFAMFFSGGQAVHYSPEFAVEGYNGASHGCVNLRDRRGVAELFDRVREGDKVVVYQS
jgi:L,D-transpeptidase catalytic domain